MTTNKYWVFLENLRKSGEVNMFGAVPYLRKAFGLKEKEAQKILFEWMDNYNQNDYEE